MESKISKQDIDNYQEEITERINTTSIKGITEQVELKNKYINTPEWS